jgi:NADPH:quinone reductase-like Zn-dependent oxidoreductase
MRERPIPSALILFREIAALVRKGVLRSEIGRVFPLDEVGQATREAGIIGRHGKVLVSLGQGR